jgi:hypothetical protein
VPQRIVRFQPAPSASIAAPLLSCQKDKKSTRNQQEINKKSIRNQ